MGRARFLRLELRYGCHWAVALDIPKKHTPVVIAGPNGAGKTTLVEGLVRTLFGFSRRAPAERELLASRAPWGREECRGTADLIDSHDTRWRIARVFNTDTVEILKLDSDEAPWRGDGNPSATNQEALDYRMRLRDIFGLSKLEYYESTSFIAQGELIETQLREELLQVATGGYGNVHEALDYLQKEHRVLTLRAIAEGERDGRKFQRLESTQAEIDRLQVRLTEAEAVTGRRAPIQGQLDKCGTRVRELESEIGQLERALVPLHQRETIKARIATLSGERNALFSLKRRLDATTRELQQAAQQKSRHAGEEYPEDFLERTGRIEALWSQADPLKARLTVLEKTLREIQVPPIWFAPAAGGLLVLSAIVGRVLSDELPLAVIPAAVGLLVWAWLALRRVKRLRFRDAARRDQERTEEDLTRLRQDLVGELAKVPGGEDLTPATVRREKQLFSDWKRIVEATAHLRRQLQGLMAEAEETLERHWKGENSPDALPDPQGREHATDSLLARAGALVDTCDREVERCRTDIAKEELRLEHLAIVEIPSGVEPSPQSVQVALDQRRLEKDKLAQSIRQLERRLLEEGTCSESVVALKDQLEVLEAERAEVERRVRSYEEAHGLLRTAYQDFREGDQRRLVESVSVALESLTSGAIGPLEAAGTLAEAQVRLHDRLLDLRSPPLSYGEFHAALLGIRLGASDFLARADVRPPLIVDEPFAFLDPERAQQLWQFLRRIAAERQVIVVTQETLVLDALGVSPDIELKRSE